MILKTKARQALLWAVAGVLSGCGLAESPPFTPERILQAQRELAAEAPVPVIKPLPTTLQSVMPPNATVPATMPARTPPTHVGPAVALTLQEVIHRTMANNLDARVAGYEASVDEARILEAKARFDPVFFSEMRARREPQDFTGRPVAFDPLDSLTHTFRAGVRQNLPDGGQIELSEQVERRESLDAATETDIDSNPGYVGELMLKMTQPLLRDFGGEVNRARITIARYDQRISQLDWRDKLERALTDVEEAYWRLYQAQMNVRIQEELLRQTEDTLDILLKRLKQDTSRAQVSQGYSAVENRRAELVRLVAQIGDFSDQIKRIMNDPDLQVVDPRTVLPADKPMEEGIAFVLEDQITAALENRFDLLQQKLRIKSAGTIVGAAKNNVLPQLNLEGSIGIQGRESEWNQAIDQQWQPSFVTYSVGLSFEVPFGNRGARAIYLRTLLTQQQAMVQYRALIETAGLEVKRAYRQVETSWNEIIATKNARFAAKDALDALTQRERAGISLTPEFVQLKLDRQQTLALAARAEVEAIVSYNVAVSQLERAKGTILRYDNVVMKEETATVMQRPAKKK